MNNDECLINCIVITKEEYKELLECKVKAKQYKSYILDNTNNNNLVKAMITIEGKNLYELIDENKRK